jgi:hypothetical protein
MSNLAGTSLDRVSDTGGSVRVTIASNVGQGNGGTSLQCKEVTIIPASANAGSIRMNIGTACTSSTGIPIFAPGASGYTIIVSVAIDDINKLYFYDSNATGDLIDILYRS